MFGKVFSLVFLGKLKTSKYKIKNKKKKKLIKLNKKKNKKKKRIAAEINLQKRLKAKENKRNLLKKYLPASAVPEAALIIPIFIFLIMLLVSVMIVTGTQLRVRKAVFDGIRKTAVLPEIVESSGSEQAGNINALKSMGVAILNEKVKEYAAQSEGLEKRINGGASGINIVSADIFSSDAKMRVTASYNAMLPLNAMAAGNILVNQEVMTYAWLGDRYMKPGADSERMVYITPHGYVYHEDINCAYLRPSVVSTNITEIPSKRNASGEKYKECEACTRKSNINPYTVYITTYGNRFHTERTCVKIRHEVIAVPFSQVSDRQLCSKERGKGLIN